LMKCPVLRGGLD